MTPLDLARAFLAKAREDEVLLEKLESDRDVSDDIFGFHVQQAAEKYVKAVLAVGETPPEKSHDLGALLNAVERAGIEVPEDVRAVDEWGLYAVRNRYPFLGETPPVDRSAALRLVEIVRRWADNVVAN